MAKIIRYIIIPAATAAAIAGIAAFFNVPNPVADAITGATLRVDAAQSPVLEGAYIFVMNKGSAAFAEADYIKKIKAAVAANGTGEDLSLVPSFSLAVSKSDPALVQYAIRLCEALRASGADVRLKEYEKTMLRSRVPAGKYDAFIASRGFTDAEAVKNSDYIMLKAEEMDRR